MLKMKFWVFFYFCFFEGRLHVFCSLCFLKSPMHTYRKMPSRLWQTQGTQPRNPRFVESQLQTAGGFSKIKRHRNKEKKKKTEGRMGAKTARACLAGAPQACGSAAAGERRRPQTDPATSTLLRPAPRTPVLSLSGKKSFRGGGGCGPPLLAHCKLLKGSLAPGGLQPCAWCPKGPVAPLLRGHTPSGD